MTWAASWPASECDVDRGVRALLGLGGDVAAGTCDEGVDPHRVALVLVGLDRDGAAVVGGRLDDLVPGDRLAHVEAGLLDERLAVPEDLGVGPERRHHELVVPGGGRGRALEGLLAERVLHVLRDLGEVAGVRELRREGRVDAHDVDLGVTRREPPGQLDPLLVGIRGEDLRGDRVVVRGARLRDGGLAAGVGVGVPGELGGPAVVAGAGNQAEHARHAQSRCTHPSPRLSALLPNRGPPHGCSSPVVVWVTVNWCAGPLGNLRRPSGRHRSAGVTQPLPWPAPLHDGFPGAAGDGARGVPVPATGSGSTSRSKGVALRPDGQLRPTARTTVRSIASVNVG